MVNVVLVLANAYVGGINVKSVKVTVAYVPSIR